MTEIRKTKRTKKMKMMRIIKMDVPQGILWLLLSTLLIGMTFHSAYANQTLDEMQTILKARSSAVGIDTHADAFNQTNEQQGLGFMQPLQQDYVVVLFYESTCPHCRRLAPVLKAFADAARIKVQAYSVDGNRLPEFPQTETATANLINAFYGDAPKVVPGLFLMNPQNGHVYPVSVGDMSERELKTRMQALVPKVLQHEGAVQ